jgi:CRISPR-associated endonuclease/helicase Cas3
MDAPDSDSCFRSGVQFVAHFRGAGGPWQGLDEHLRSVSVWARRFAEKIGMPLLGELCGLLHDLGKYSIAFQLYLKSAVGLLNPDEDDMWVDPGRLRGKIDHSTAGAQFIWQHTQVRTDLDASCAAQIAALCIASHHSGLIDCIAPNGDDNFTRRMSKAAGQTHLDEVCRAAHADILARAREILDDPELRAEVKRLRERIAAANPHALTPQLQQFGLFVRFIFSCLISGDRIDAADFESPERAGARQRGNYAGWPSLVMRLESHLARFEPRHPIDQLRRDISASCLEAASRDKGIYPLTVPTGGGKTLASLRFALHHAAHRNLDRVIYVIPFTSIIEQNASVVRHVLEPACDPASRGRVVLEHHSNLTPEQQTWREKVLTEDWDAPVVYTTMVLLLETLFGGGTRSARRMHQLANSVLVFDEVQTLPVRCVHLFNNALNFLVEQCNSTALLCTATQPLLDQVKADKGAVRFSPAGDLIPDVSALFEALKRVDVHDLREPGGWSDEQVAQLAREQFCKTGSCLAIVNTKALARSLFELISPHVDGDSLYHLSTDMCPVHRQMELVKVRDRLSRGQPVLCVSTQLIEAGVDVDFDVVIRTLAGLDSIAQAAGRCNRNGRLERGHVYIVDPSSERLSMLPDIAIGREHAKRVLDDFRADPARYDGNLFGTKAMRDYYRYYFFARAADMSYDVPNGALGFNGTLLELLSGNERPVAEYKRRNRKAPPYFFRQPFMTASQQFKAIDSSTQGIVVPYGPAGIELIDELCKSPDLATAYALMRRAQQYSVNVFDNVFAKLVRLGAVHPISDDLRIYRLDPSHYSERFGLSI